MPAGRPRKPLEQKRATARSSTKDSAGRPLPAPGQLIALPGSKGKPPAFPDRLIEDGPGRERWTEIWTRCEWISPEVDLGVVTRLCENEDTRWIYKKQIAEDGLMVEGSTGRMTRHSLIPEIRALDDQITKYETQLGLTPSARSSLNVAEVESQRGAAHAMVQGLIAQQAAVNGRRG